MSLLTLQNVAAWYGATQALFDVSLKVNAGEVVALMGRNGMGKTTTVKTICKMLPQASGELHFDGHNLKKVMSHQVAQWGVGLVPEGRRCFPNLSVHENLMVAARPGTWDIAAVNRLFPRMQERHKQSAALLSGGEQQMLAIGRALMTNPRLLILDEATEGLAPIVRREIWEAISVLKGDTGLAILVVDKPIEELSRVADRMVILERGCSVWSGAAEALSDNIVSQYLGV